MFATVPNPIPARMKGLNRAEICDVNFQEFVRGWNGTPGAAPAAGEAVLGGRATKPGAARTCASQWRIAGQPPRSKPPTLATPVYANSAMSATP